MLDIIALLEQACGGRCNAENNPCEYKEAALELERQKPVAWMLPDYGDVLSASEADGTGIYNIPLYTAPPKQWVGLTVEEIKEILYGLLEDDRTPMLTLIDVVQEKLKEKNGGS